MKKQTIEKEYKEVRKNLEEVGMDYYICGNTSYFSDDVKRKCCKCKKNVSVRPYYPRNTKLICISCMNKIRKKEKKSK